MPVEDGFELEFAEVAGLPPCRLPLGSCVDVRFERAAPVRSFVWTVEIPLDDEVEQVPHRGAVLRAVDVKPGQASAAHGRRVHVARPSPSQGQARALTGRVEVRLQRPAALCQFCAGAPKSHRVRGMCSRPSPLSCSTWKYRLVAPATSWRGQPRGLEPDHGMAVADTLIYRGPDVGQPGVDRLAPRTRDVAAGVPKRETSYPRIELTQRAQRKIEAEPVVAVVLVDRDGTAHCAVAIGQPDHAAEVTDLSERCQRARCRVMLAVLALSSLPAGRGTAAGPRGSCAGG